MKARRRNILILGIVGGAIIIFIALFGAMNQDNAPVFNLVLFAGLIVVTMFYAYYSMETANAAREQADASLKIAEETREQRIMASRPVIIQKAVVETETEFATFGSKDWFSYFEVYNAGNGPAIEVEISLLNNEKTPIHSQRETFLRADEPPIQFYSHPIYPEKPTFYLVCEYQSILSRETWYQTWLPFEAVEASEEEKIYVKPGKLEFKEVTEKERINAFGIRRNNSE